MPLYEYKCKKCEHEFEATRKMSEDNPMCPECGKDVERLISGGGSFRLNGRGWGKDGYSKKVGDQKGYPKSHLGK